MLPKVDASVTNMHGVHPKKSANELFEMFSAPSHLYEHNPAYHSVYIELVFT